jgi:hypothetical protein
MPKYYDITPSEFIYKYLVVPEDQFCFMRLKDTVYLIDSYILDDYDGEYDFVIDTYNAKTFSKEFAGSEGLYHCCRDLQDYIESHIYSDGSFDDTIMSWLEDYCKADLPQDTSGFGYLFITGDMSSWYSNLESYNWFGSEIIKTICEVVSFGGEFAPEAFPAEKDAYVLEALDYWGDK